MLFRSTENLQQPVQQGNAIDSAKAVQSSASDKNEPVMDDANSHKVISDNGETKKSAPPPRNHELERLGVLAAPVINSRRQTTVKKSTTDDDNNADNKSSPKILPNSHSATDDKSPTPSDDESMTSETDIDLASMSDEDISNGSDTEEVMSDDTDNEEVVIVSEVKGKNRDRDSLKKSVDRRGHSATALAAATFKKPTATQHAVSHSGSSSSLHEPKQASSSSSWWVNKVNLLETAMAEMKSKFAEVLRQKVCLKTRPSLFRLSKSQSLCEIELLLFIVLQMMMRLLLDVCVHLALTYTRVIASLLCPWLSSCFLCTFLIVFLDFSFN